MHSLQLHTLPPLSLAIPKPLLKPSSTFPKFPFPCAGAPFRRCRPPHCYSSDEFPVGDDDAYLSSIVPKEKESEDEARRRNWIERGWAPWDEILTPEADFARKSLNEGEEVPLQTPEAIEAFRMLSPKYREQKIKDMGLTEDEYLAKQFEIKGEIPDPLETSWSGPLVLGMVPPRDWPPRGWEVDREELEFIRGAHKVFSSMRVDVENLEGKVEEGAGEDQMCLDRYKMFLKQYNEWVEANKDRLEEESYKYDQDYHPGRRKRGKDYKEGMYELPFYYPGQVCAGKVTAVHLYQGAFVDIGGTYDGLVLIKRNDWYWLRHHIKVGMHVVVEILAKRDPYRYRFPIELRFVYPNIDHLIFNKFDFPPIFHRDEDTNPDELRRDCGRPPVPRKDHGIKWEEEPLLSNHPYCDKLWQIHNAEHMILDDMMANSDKYAGKKLTELIDAEDFDEEKTVEYGEAYFNKALLPKLTLNVSVKELDLEAALAERQHHEKLRKEAEARGEKYKIKILRRNKEMNDYDFIHWRRSFEEREALLRDISCRQALGLPLEEPGRYLDPKLARKDEYDPNNPLYRYDYWGEPKNSEKSKEERMTDAHNKSIVGKGTVWYEMSYENAIEQKKQMEAMGIKPRQYDEDDELESNPDDDSADERDDLIYSILTSPTANEANQPHVNGTESSRLTDEGLFED